MIAYRRLLAFYNIVLIGSLTMLIFTNYSMFAFFNFTSAITALFLALLSSIICLLLISGVYSFWKIEISEKDLCVSSITGKEMRVSLCQIEFSRNVDNTLIICFNYNKKKKAFSLSDFQNYKDLERFILEKTAKIADAAILE